MAQCSECGASIPDNTRFCPQCGASSAAAAAGAAGAASGAYQQAQQQTYQPYQQNYQQQGYQQQQQQYQQQYQQQGYQQQQQYQQPPQKPQKPKPVAPSPEAESYRILTALSYLSLIFLFLTLILGGDSNYVRKHANQAVALNLWYLLCAVCCIVPFLGWIVGGVGSIAGFIFMLICFFRALRYDFYTIPITGKWNIVPQKD